MSASVLEVIRRKRDGETLSAAEIEATVAAVTDGSMSDAQIAAFAMAVLLRGMARDETVALTRAMAASGGGLDWSGTALPGPRVDKHSTGGIGDKVSLILAPVLAACGAFVPMISGRGLGHTGGTLDKLEAIPGYDVQPDARRVVRVVAQTGCAIVGAGPGLAPADRRIYAIRDVTATVESAPLIVSSILAKKLAAGLDALVMDVKVGSGAFLPGMEAARGLARDLVEVAGDAGLPVRALVTDMSQVLGRTAGNALETREAIDCLRGEPADERLLAVTRSLAVEALCLGGLSRDSGAAAEMVESAIGGGGAAERFARMVAALGGPGGIVDAPGRFLPAAPVVVPAPAATPGRVAAVDARALGLCVVELGGGRRRAEESVDPRVGLSEAAGVGDEVGPDRPLALVHAATQAQAERAVREVREAYATEPADGGEPVRPPPVLGALG